MPITKQIPTSVIIERSKSDKILDWFKFCIKSWIFLLIIFTLSSWPDFSQELWKPWKIVSNYVWLYEDSVQKMEWVWDIAWIKISGVIANKDFWVGQWVVASESILQMLDIAKNDNDVKIIVIEINSPWWTVLDSEKITNKIKDLKNYKKVFALMWSMAASWWYYIAAHCDKIFAYDETITWSIWVIVSVPNVTALSEKIWLSRINISSWKYKAMWDPFAPLDTETRQIFQALVDESFDKFIDVVSSWRNLSKNNVRKLADWRIYSWKQALGLKLIDSNKWKKGLIDESFSIFWDLNIKLFDIKKSPLEELFMPMWKLFKWAFWINWLDFNMQAMYLMK